MTNKDLPAASSSAVITMSPATTVVGRSHKYRMLGPRWNDRHLAFDGFPEIFQRACHRPDQLVVSKALLLDHSVHGLFIPGDCHTWQNYQLVGVDLLFAATQQCWEFGFADIQREWLRQPILNRCCSVIHYLPHASRHRLRSTARKLKTHNQNPWTSATVQ